MAKQPRKPILHVTTKASDAPVIIEADGHASSTNHLHSYELDEVFDETSDTATVYDATARPLVQTVLDGMNATLMCYGMTGSGKTHTMLGDRAVEGIVGHAARQLLQAAQESGGAVTVGVSFMQLYGTVASDLLCSAGVPLKVTRDGEVVVEGQSVRAVSTPADVEAVVAEGVKRRKVCSQKLNSASSRSHAVLTFHVSTTTVTPTTTTTSEADEEEGEAEGESMGADGGSGPDGGTVLARCAKLSCVDLAGCERVKESGVSGVALREAQAINLSLFHLVRVVQALNANATSATSAKRRSERVPYADSPLTTLLSDALGGNCRTALIATLSPAQRHAAQTAASCAFAEACRAVTNGAGRVAARRVLRERPWAAANAAADSEARAVAARRARNTACAVAARLPWAGVAPGDASRCPGGRVDVGGLSCLVYGARGGGGGPAVAAAAESGVALVLHGNPSEAEDVAWLAPPLVHAGYLVVCPDMPGFGRSAGPRVATRSDQAVEPGGAADALSRLLSALGVRSATLVGYDWGAGVALAMAASGAHRRLVRSAVCMHPAYAAERTPDELCSVRAPTMVLWAEDNAFHSWLKFRPLAAKLRRRLGARSYAEHRTRREADDAWSHAARARAIVTFLTGVDPLPEAQAVAARPQVAAVAADGAAITRADGVIFREDVSAAMAARIDGHHSAALEAERTACAAVANAEACGELPTLLRRLASGGGATRAAAIAELHARSLPCLSDATISPRRLKQLGLWSAAARDAAEQLQAVAAGAPRYFPGRKLLLPRGRGVGVLRAVNTRSDAATVVAGRSADVEVVSWRELLALNQPHALPTDTVRTGAGDGDAAGGNCHDGAPVYRLEDGLWADMGSTLMRAEMARVALALEPIFARDVAAGLAALAAGHGHAALDAARCAAVVAMRRCLDVTTFAREGGDDGEPGGSIGGEGGARGRNRHRYAKDDVAKMAAYGEGHCRTCSSCLAPFLWSFADVLAIDAHYRTDAGARHQWLQYDARPSMRAFACDVYRDANAGGSGELLREPIEEASAGGGSGLRPADEPIALGGRRVIPTPLEPSDVQDVRRLL